MNRTTVGYVLMAVLAAGVLWGILKWGSHLRAAPDWSGEWEVVGPTSQRVSIQQSGVYVHIRMDGRVEPYKLASNYGWQLTGPRRQWSTPGLDGQGQLVLNDPASRTQLTLRRLAKNADGTH